MDDRYRGKKGNASLFTRGTTQHGIANTKAPHRNDVGLVMDASVMETRLHGLASSLPPPIAGEASESGQEQEGRRGFGDRLN